MATMYQTRVDSVDGKSVIDDNGDRLTRIGNMPVKVGDFVWTDGVAVYGFVEDATPTRPYVPPVAGGILYAESRTNYHDETVYRYRRSLFAKSPGSIFDVYMLVDGAAACWAVNFIDVDASKQKAIRLTDGAKFDLSGLSPSSSNDACVADDGRLIVAFGGRTPEDARIEAVRIYETSADSWQFVKVAEVTEFDNAALQSSAIGAVRNLCPGGTDSVYAGNPGVSIVAVHPDKSWNAVVSMQANTQSGRAPVTVDAFHDVYRVWDLRGDAELIFESDEMVSDSWSGTRPRNASVVRRYVFNSDGTYKRVYSWWEWHEAQFTVHGPSYDRQIYTEEDRDAIPPYYVQELERLGFDVSEQPLPFEISHRYYCDTLPSEKAEGGSYDNAVWRLDDADSIVEFSRDGVSCSAMGHTVQVASNYDSFIRDAYATGETVLLTVAGDLREYNREHSGPVNEKPVHNYRTRHCNNITQANAIIETL